jgi:hypothetical protein
MPNWCENKVTISGPEAERERFRRAVKGPDREGNSCDLNFDKLVPVPDGFYETDQWWEFCNSRWGTKWLPLSMDVTVNEGSLSYQFDTANSPALAVFEEAAAQFPLLIFDYAWAELSNELAGWARFADGGTRASGEPSDEGLKAFAIEHGFADEEWWQANMS